MVRSLSRSLANAAIAEDDDETRARTGQPGAAVSPWRFDAAVAPKPEPSALALVRPDDDDDDDDLAQTLDAKPAQVMRAAKAMKAAKRKPSPAAAPRDPRAERPSTPPWRARATKVAEQVSRIGDDDATNEIPPPPDSGVRPSVTNPILPPALAGRPAKALSESISLEKAPKRLSYSMYTVADIEKRGDVPRSSVTFAPDLPTTRLPAWRVVGVSSMVLYRALRGYVLSPKPRPRFLDVLRFPLTTFAEDLRVALRGVAWKKVGAGLAFAAVALVVLLLAVLTAAELTDDLKPRRPEAAKVLAPKPAEARPADPPTSATIEIDQEPPMVDDLPATPPAAPPAAAKPKPVVRSSPPASKPPFVSERYTVASAVGKNDPKPGVRPTAPAPAAPAASAAPKPAPAPASVPKPRPSGGANGKSDDLKNLLN